MLDKSLTSLIAAQSIISQVIFPPLPDPELFMLVSKQVTITTDSILMLPFANFLDDHHCSCKR